MSVGLICEFNPFHYGHRYIINKIKELTGEHVICIMSGPFVQRGEPACVNKFARTRIALENGADAVIELPVKFSIAAAKNFAQGGVEVLKHISDISSLAFGVETNHIDKLYDIAKIKRSPNIDKLIGSEMYKGNSYPKAVSNAILKASSDESLIEILDRPNNILAIEYLEALNGTNISALPIPRIGSGYNDMTLGQSFASASAIRENLNSNNIALEKYMPIEMLEICHNEKPNYKTLDTLILYSLRKLSLQELRQLPDVECGLEYQIKKAADLPSVDRALDLLKSKRYTYARLKRIFLYALLGATKQIMSDINSIKTRVLGIKKEFRSNLSNFDPNIITRNSDADLSYRESTSVKIDAFADDVYSLLTNTTANDYYKTPMIIV